MSYGFFKLCKSNPKGTIEDANELISQILNELSKTYPSTFHQLSFLINNRKIAFNQQIYSLDIEYNRQQYINAFVHFAQTLNNYLENPDNISNQIKQYHDSNAYCHVGGINNEFSYTVYDTAASYTLAIGLSMFLLSLIIMPFSLPSALILIAISITLITPSFFYLLLITRPNSLAIKEEEIALFMEAQQLINPDDVVELDEQPNYEDNYSC